MIQIDEKKLTNGTLSMIGYDLGIVSDPNVWIEDISKYQEDIDKVVEMLRVKGDI